MGTIKILVVVEDDADMRMLIRASLNVDPRLEVVGEAVNADEAIALCSTTEPGLIILDHMLESGKTGMEAAPELKRAAPSACILLFSALDLKVQAATEPSIDFFLKKTDIQELLPTIQRLLGLDPAPN